MPAFQSAAPGQPIQFVAAGGVPPYTFAFPQGGQLSGGDASLDPAGAYTAGSMGSAQDLVQVQDSRGTIALATVSVGQRIAISPAFTGTNPGGRITFQATGGSGSYTFAIGTSGSGGTVDLLTGVYGAGGVGSSIDTVFASDAYGGLSKAEVQVGQAVKLYRSETRPLAPRESVTLIVIGGKPPYTFAIGPNPGSGNPTIDPNNGDYTAGDRGADADPSSFTSDLVTVTDSANAPQTAQLWIPIGARLALRLDSPSVFPGQAAQLVATGGMPPYTFGFSARVPRDVGDPDRVSGGNGGNRSHGAVNATTGEYVPGFSPGAVDFFQVTDATAAPAAIAVGPVVGPLVMAIGGGVNGCVTGDLNGDTSGDVAFFFSGDAGAKVTTAMNLDTAEPWLQSYFLKTYPGQTFVDDFAGTGRDAIAIVGGDVDCSGGTCGNSDFWALTPGLGGWLTQGPLAGGGTPTQQNWVNVLNDLAYQNGTGTGYHRETTNYEVRNGTGRFEASTGTWQFWGQGWDADTIQTSTSSPGPAACANDPTFNNTDGWLVRVDWKVGDPRPARPACVEVKNLCSTCVGGAYHQPIAMGVGDFNNDGVLDLAYVLDTDGNRLADGTKGAKLSFAYGTGTGSFTFSTSSWPTGGPWNFEKADRTAAQSRFQVVRSGSRDVVLVRLVDTSTGRGQLFVYGPVVPGIWKTNAALDTTGAGLDGFVAAPDSGTSFYAWTGNEGTVLGFSMDASYSLVSPSIAASLPFPVNAVCLPDANADGVPDLVAASNFGSSAELLLGDGAQWSTGVGTFGKLSRQRGLSYPIATGDFDGDGFLDAVVGNESGNGLSVLWGGGGMLAWGTQISSASVSVATTGWYSNDLDQRPSVFFQEKTGRFGTIRSKGNGTFDPAVALSSYSATGGAPQASLFIWPADLGTAAPGIDALTFGVGNGGKMVPRALLVQLGRVVDVTAQKAIPPLDGVLTSTEDCWFLPVGTAFPQPQGGAAIAVACSYSSQNGANQYGMAIWGATLLRVNSPPSATPGNEPAFSDWTLVTSTVVGDTLHNYDPAYTKPVNTVNGAQTRLRLAMLGTAFDPDYGETVAAFAFTTDQVYVVEVRPNGSPASPSAWKAKVLPASASQGFYPFIGRLGKLDADPNTRFHAVIGGGGASGGASGGGSMILKRTAAGYTMTQRLGIGGFPMGIGPLSMSSPSPATRSPGDVVMFIGDWGNAGLLPEITVLLNDGTGKTR
ncbi:MAG TPA: VCBS repeat-containing protein [Anaeromyxobacter sp.]